MAVALTVVVWKSFSMAAGVPFAMTIGLLLMQELCAGN